MKAPRALAGGIGNPRETFLDQFARGGAPGIEVGGQAGECRMVWHGLLDGFLCDFTVVRTISDDGLAYKRSHAPGMRPCDSTAAGTVDGDRSMSHQDRNERVDARIPKETSRYGGACARETQPHT